MLRRNDFKRNWRFANGFTLAEILVSMVILALVATFSVPLLAKDKIKKPVLDSSEHGTFECYYDAAGQLVQFTANNRNNKSGTTTNPTDGACTFTPPSDVNYFMVQVIGAGSDGRGFGDSDRPSWQVRQGLQSGATTGHIDLDSRFRAEMDALRANPRTRWVFELWNNQWRVGRRIYNPNNLTPAPEPATISYDIFTPLGASGSSVAIEFTQSGCPEQCNNNWVDLVACAGCKQLRTEAGGDSGYGAKIRIPNVKLQATDNITTNTDGNNNFTLKFNNNDFISVASSGSGTHAQEINNAVRAGDSGQPLTFGDNAWRTFWNERININRATTLAGVGWQYVDSTDADNFIQKGGAAGDVNIGKERQAGRYVVAGTQRIDYAAIAPQIEARFCPAGNPGSIDSRAYEKLPGKSLRLIPARDAVGEGGVRTQSLVQAIDGNSVVDIQRAFSGEAVDWTVDNTIRVYGSGDFPFASTHYPELFRAKAPAISYPTNSSFASRLRDLFNSNGNQFIPGESGAGSYPIIQTSMKDNANRNINSYKVINQVIVQQEPVEIGIGRNPFCNLGGNVAGNSGDYYCTATRGKSGAILITW